MNCTKSPEHFCPFAGDTAQHNNYSVCPARFFGTFWHAAICIRNEALATGQLETNPQNSFYPPLPKLFMIANSGEETFLDRGAKI